jgi:hypothetical protein
MKTKLPASRGVSVWWGSLTAGIFSSILLTACSQTVGSTPVVMESGQLSPAVSGFFSDSYSLLQPRQEGQVAMVYINPSAQWRQYNKILLEPIEFWDSRIPTSRPLTSTC